MHFNRHDSHSIKNQTIETDESGLVPFVLAAPRHASSYSMPESAPEELSEEQCDAIIGGIQPSFNRSDKPLDSI
ncbi:MAG: hypothetical protein F6K42_25355 [Leptolyngbya sp. SIO1D8]|nr:hypothetical protein [Leptolyngbya sp. SIO1D8]